MNPGEFCWNELATANLEKAKEFYSKVFGWKFTEHDMGDMKYTIINLNGKDIGGIWSIPKDKENKIPPHWMSYILVSNVDESLKKAEENGATIIKPKTKAGEMGLLGILQDPTGAHFALWQPLQNK